MRRYRYQVNFIAGGSEEVYAMTKEQAIILAQAERIEKGLEYKQIKDIFINE